MIFGKDDSSSSSDEDAEGEDLFGKKTSGPDMMMMPQGKYHFYAFIIIFP